MELVHCVPTKGVSANNQGKGALHTAKAHTTSLVKYFHLGWKEKDTTSN